MSLKKDVAYQRLIRVAQYRAELSKIALSTQTSDRIFADESQIGARDRNGKEIYLDVEISRDELNSFVIEEIDRSIELCRKLILDSGYRNEDIDRVVLIGGPSRMPIVRERIGSQLGIRADLDTDPMTSVAVGAAIYAESREWTEEGTITKKSRKSKSVTGKIDVQYDYPARTADKQFRVRVKIGTASKAKGARIQITNEEGWTSGQLELEGLTEVRNIPIPKTGENRFKISVIDVRGIPIAEATSEISIVRSEAAAAGMPMTHNLAVKVVSSISGIEKNTLFTFVRKGTLLPKSGAEHFRASRDFRSGDGGCLEFEVYQQAEDVSDPSLNLPVGAFRLFSNNLEKGDVIRRGDPVVVHWLIDENGLLDSNLEFTKISQTYNTGKMYVSAEGHKNFDGEAGHRIASEAIGDARSDVDALERALGSEVSESVQKMRSRLAKQQEAIKLSNDADARRGVSEESLMIRQEIARIKNDPAFVRATLRSDIDQFVEEFAVSVSSVIDQKIIIQIHRLAGLARDSLNKNRPNSLDDARRSFDEIRGLLFGALAKLPDFWIARFESLAEDRHLAVDKELHDRLVQKGEAAIRSNDVDTVRDLTFRLKNNHVRVGDPSGNDVLAGLTRE